MILEGEKKTSASLKEAFWKNLNNFRVGPFQKYVRVTKEKGWGFGFTVGFIWNEMTTKIKS